MRALPLLLGVLVLAGCRSSETPSSEPADAPTDRTTAVRPGEDPPGTSYAIFAGGCFWCVEADFDKVPGVRSTTSGYAGGSEANPTYEEVGSGRTGHAESVRVVYDSTRVSYARLLEYFWHHHDPLTGDGQFCDHGPQYRPLVFTRTARQRALADSLKAVYEARFGRAVATQVVPETPFYRAEGYHQDFYRKDPERYHSYRLGCRRDARVAQVWGRG